MKPTIARRPPSTSIACPSCDTLMVIDGAIEKDAVLECEECGADTTFRQAQARATAIQREKMDAARRNSMDEVARESLEELKEIRRVMVFFFALAVISILAGVAIALAPYWR